MEEEEYTLIDRGGRKFFQVLLRMPVEMVEHMDKASKASYRSRTGEILMRLEESMRGESFDAHGCIVKSIPSGVHAPTDNRSGGQ
ncbi:MAG: Arc family DNA-binding protein [Hydrogenophaga sp.]|nr:Arc family DNA-binding protein [Hydrogenophaga sp.]